MRRERVPTRLAFRHSLATAPPPQCLCQASTKVYVSDIPNLWVRKPMSPMRPPSPCSCVPSNSPNIHLLCGDTLTNRKVGPLRCSSSIYTDYFTHPEGHIYLIFMTQQLPFPPDGIRYQDQEQKIIMPAGPGRVRFNLIHLCTNPQTGAMPGTRSHGGQVRFRPQFFRYNSLESTETLPDAQGRSSATGPHPLRPWAANACV